LSRDVKRRHATDGGVYLSCQTFDCPDSEWRLVGKLGRRDRYRTGTLMLLLLLLLRTSFAARQKLLLGLGSHMEIDKG
jgi:hypothetical protein